MEPRNGTSMDDVKKILNIVRDAMTARLSSFVSEALSDANMAIANEPASRRSRDLSLMAERDAIVQRFAKVNPRLLLDLGKALEVAGIEKPEAEESLGKLKRVQEACFETPPAVVSDEDVASVGVDNEKTSLVKSTTGRQEPLDDDEHLQEVSNYPIGIWLEFEGGAEQAVRCTLAAKIDTIGKYVFVNGQGVKVIEKSKWD